MSTNFDLRLYAVTDRAWVGQQTFYEQVEEALKSGVTMLQLREKDMEESKFIEEAEKIKKLTDYYKVPLIINDNISVALACDAAGVHIGQEDMPIEQARELLGRNKILGVTAKTVEQARQAQRLGADYLGSGAVFGSSTKKNAKPMSTDTLLEITKSVQIPVVAIGGISSDNISLLNHTGIAGVAVVSGIFAKENIAGEVHRLRRKIQEHIIPAKVLTIAGSDCSGGAGIQADLKTMQSLGAYGMSVITALTAQNTTGVYGVVNTEPKFVEKQIQVVLEDIFPDAIKIGMVSTKENALAIANALKKYSIKNLVIDPVMISTSGSRLISEDAVKVMEQKLFTLATVITPNIPEAEYLCGFAIDTEEKMQRAAKMLSEKYHTAILLKGGHQVGTANDILYQDEKITWFKTQRIENPNTHGTGCRLSSAIAANLAMGEGLEDSIKRAKEYLSKLISQQLNLGKGSGPLR